MGQKRLLIQAQLSNYNTKGNFILEADSGFQMVMGRVRVMLQLNPELHITVMIPQLGDDGRKRQVVTDPWDVYPDLWDRYGPDGDNRLAFFEHNIIGNALVTRYDFDWTGLAVGLNLGMQKLSRAPKWDAVYINDPMHLRAFKAMFHVVGGYQPKFFVHSHFVDVPSCPKFPAEASLWLGQCEAAMKADWNFWQCESALAEFEVEARKLYRDEVVQKILEKSSPWDDGYSREEITSPVNFDNLRFDVNLVEKLQSAGKKIIFVPNRIGEAGVSSDYTNCGKFMFDILPKLHNRRQDFVVIAGNPSQKISNSSLQDRCGRHGYVSLVSGPLNRDEFKYIASRAEISVGLYDQDTYGGTAARECTELGCIPFWISCNEYSRLARDAGGHPFMGSPDFSDAPDVLSKLLDEFSELSAHTVDMNYLRERLRDAVRARCSYEVTTLSAMQKMNLLCNVD
jgi:hypothetical protein